VPQLNRQQFCAEFAISESTVRRMELDGMPVTIVGKRGKRYDPDECQRWMRECRSGQIGPVAVTSASWSQVSGFIESCRKVQVRAMPSGQRQLSDPRLVGQS